MMFDFTGNTTKESLGVGSNIKVVDWAPQNDILGHAAVKAFVTHAGSNGLYEAAFHGKPVVSVPIMNEQPDNAAKVSCAPPSPPPPPWLACSAAQRALAHSLNATSAGEVFTFSVQWVHRCLLTWLHMQVYSIA